MRGAFLLLEKNGYLFPLRVIIAVCGKALPVWLTLALFFFVTSHKQTSNEKIPH